MRVGGTRVLTITTTTLLRSNRCGVRQLDVLPKEPFRLRSLLLRHGGEQLSAALLPACHNFRMGAALAPSSRAGFGAGAGFAASASRRFSCLSRLRCSARSRSRSFSFATLRSARKISNVSLRGSSPNCSGRVNTQSMYSCSRCSCAADGLSQRCSFRLTSSLRKRSRSRSARPTVANSRSVARWPAGVIASAHSGLGSSGSCLGWLEKTRRRPFSAVQRRLHANTNTENGAPLPKKR